MVRVFVFVLGVNHRIYCVAFFIFGWCFCCCYPLFPNTHRKKHAYEIIGDNIIALLCSDWLRHYVVIRQPILFYLDFASPLHISFLNDLCENFFFMQINLFVVIPFAFAMTKWQRIIYFKKKNTICIKKWLAKSITQKCIFCFTCIRCIFHCCAWTITIELSFCIKHIFEMLCPHIHTMILIHIQSHAWICKCRSNNIQAKMFEIRAKTNHRKHTKFRMW